MSFARPNDKVETENLGINWLFPMMANIIGRLINSGVEFFAGHADHSFGRSLDSVAQTKEGFRARLAGRSLLNQAALEGADGDALVFLEGPAEQSLSRPPKVRREVVRPG